MNKTETKKEIKMIIQDLENCKIDLESEHEWFSKIESAFSTLEDVLSEKNVDLNLTIEDLTSDALNGLKEDYLSDIVSRLEDLKADIEDQASEASERTQEKIEIHYENLDSVIEKLQPESSTISLDELIDDINNCIDDLEVMMGPYAS